MEVQIGRYEPDYRFPRSEQYQRRNASIDTGGKVLGTFPLYKGNKSELVAMISLRVFL